MTTVPVKDVEVIGSRRAVDPKKVKLLMKSIKTVGLISPISITPDGVLIAGAHRLEAFKLLKIDEIPAVIMDLKGIHKELAEIDENLVRSKYNSLEMSMYLARRKEIYEELNPQTKKGGDRTSKGKKQTTESVISFAKDTSSQTGKSETVIRESAKIGKNLSKPVIEIIKDTPIADNKEELKALASVPKQQQVKVAEKVLSGQAKSVQEVVKPKPVNNAGNYQPGDLTRTNLPPMQPLSEKMKAKDPELDADGFIIISKSTPADPIKAKSALMEELAEELLALYPPTFQTTVVDIIRSHNTPTSKYGVKDAFYYGVMALAEKKKP